MKDQLSSTNESGYRMTVSPDGFPVALCMSPDLTVGMGGSDLVGWTQAGDDGSDILVASTPGAEFASAEVKFKPTIGDGDRLFVRLGVVVTP